MSTMAAEFFSQTVNNDLNRLEIHVCIFRKYSLNDLLF